MRKLSRKAGDEEKVALLLKEVQNMKNQMFFLQQSVLQLRTQVGGLKNSLSDWLTAGPAGSGGCR